MKALIPMLFLLASCSSVYVSKDYKEGHDFKTLKTYRWLEKTGEEDSLIRSRVRTAVDVQLKGKGYVVSESKGTDFVVDYEYQEPPYDRRAGVSTGVGLGLGSNGFSTIGVGFGSGHRVQSEKLAVKILNSSLDELWVGRASEQLKAEKPSETTENFNHVVKEILQHFPPK